jgi:hypothetical protein
VIPGEGADAKHEYVIIYKLSNKADAEAACKQLGATLATVQSLDQNMKLYESMASFFKQQQTEPAGL